MTTLHYLMVLSPLFDSALLYVLQDAMQVVRNVVFDPRMLPGGGATELAISQAINRSVNDIEGESLSQSVKAHCII